MVDKKKPFFVCIFCFKKVFFVNHFLKRYKLCVVALPSKRFFLSTIFCQVTVFVSFLTWYPFPAPFLGKGVKRKVFRRKTCVPSFSTFLLENLCRGPPFLFYVFVRTQVFGTWHPFPAPFLGKGVKRKVFRRKTFGKPKVCIFSKNG